MSEHDSLYRQGMISGDQWAKLGKQSGTKPQKTKMADFDDKGGRRDQGGGRGRGIKETGSKHIETNKGIGTPERASGAPSKGGRVNAYGKPGSGEINESNAQRPVFPSGSKVRGKNAKKKLSAVPSAASAGAKSGPQYGGPSSRKYG